MKYLVRDWESGLYWNDPSRHGNDDSFANQWVDKRNAGHFTKENAQEIQAYLKRILEFKIELIEVNEQEK